MIGRKPDGTFAQGVDHPRSMMNDVLVCEARRRARAGESLIDLSACYPVAKEVLRQALRGGTWKNCSEPPVSRGEHQEAIRKMLLNKKRCGKCGSVGPFYQHSNRRDGLTKDCKQCIIARTAENIERRLRHDAEGERIKTRKRSKTKGYGRKAAAKRRTNPMLCLNHRIGNAIRASLRGKKNGRPWQELVCYTIADLRQHLERQFKPGMTWDNFGEWHIDHVIPLSFFQFTSPDDIDFKRAWSLSNLQPLWAYENLAKGSTMP